MPLSAGMRLGPYEILAPLGSGGMGEVYRARDSRLEREVALKVLSERSACDPDALKRFEREAKTLAALAHPNILTIHDVGREGDVCYLIMELLEGETLRTRLEKETPRWPKAVEWTITIAEGLAAAHSKGVVHRDLKPENIFVTSDARIKILDFGLARWRSILNPGEEEEAATVSGIETRSGVVLGTIPYMSPEQVRGEKVDLRSDIFSLGCVLHEMISGQRTFFRHSAAETAAAILKEEPEKLS